MVDRRNTYFLIEDADNTIYKMPLETLGDLLIMNNDENEKIIMVTDAINELSTYLLELSANFINEHYSMEELSAEFELLSETDGLLIDKQYLTEADIYKYVEDTDIVSVADVENQYDEEESDADKVFDNVGNESEQYF